MVKTTISTLTLLFLTSLTIIALAANFKDNGDGTITDNSTGLMWQQKEDGEKRIWNDSLSYCKSLSLVDKSGWRLPEINELKGLLDRTKSNPVIDTNYFPEAKPSPYWSVTNNTVASITGTLSIIDGKSFPAENASVTFNVKGIDFGNGHLSYYDNDEKHFVRCVRKAP